MSHHCLLKAMISIGAAALLGIAGSALAAVYTVGPDAACNFHAIMQAVAAAAANPGANSIEVVGTGQNDTTFTTQAISIVNQDVSIVGGYQSCGAVAPTSFTPIDGLGNGGSAVFTISGSSNVSLSNLTIFHGLRGALNGGGILVDGNGTLTVTSSTIQSNKAGSGAGIYMHESGGSLTVVIDATSLIAGNQALVEGGGIDVQGGTLTLRGSEVQGNSAPRGGGIAITSTSNMQTTISSSIIDNNDGELGGGIWSTGPGQLHIEGPKTHIFRNNVEYDGGALYIEEGTRLFILDAGVLIEGNESFRDGAGLEIVGPARADIGSAEFYDNEAFNNGGGISVDASQNLGQAVLRLLSTDPSYPARISGNIAKQNGGGIYLKPSATGQSMFGHATLCAHDFRMDANLAIEGAAIYADALTTAGGSEMLLEPASDETAQHGCDPEPPSALGAVACFGIECNSIDGNQSVDVSTGATTNGATIFGNIATDLSADRLAIRANVGGYALNMNYGSAVLSNCLFAENQPGVQMIVMNGTPLSIQNCTLTNDFPGTTYSISSDSSLQISDSIIAEYFTTSLLPPGNTANLQIHNLLTNNTLGLPSDPSIVVDAPLFVDLKHSDYRLQATKFGDTITASPAIDFAEAAGGFDIAGNPRDQDVVLIANRFGSRDLGAYEMQPITDRLFADGFGDPISLVY